MLRNRIKRPMFISIGSPFGSAPLVSVTGTAANPELLPENTKSYEFGVEAALFRSRAGFDITYYNAKTFNQIFAVPVSTSTGYNSKFLNAGNIRNKGMELSVYGTPVQTKDFSWNINVNCYPQPEQGRRIDTGY